MTIQCPFKGAVHDRGTAIPSREFLKVPVPPPPFWNHAFQNVSARWGSKVVPMGFELAPPARETRDLPLHYIEVDTRGSFKLKVNANPAQPFGARDCNGILDWQINPPIEIGVASKTIGLKIGGFQFIIIIIIYYYKVIIITFFSKATISGVSDTRPAGLWPPPYYESLMSARPANLIWVALYSVLCGAERTYQSRWSIWLWRAGHRPGDSFEWF